MSFSSDTDINEIKLFPKQDEFIFDTHRFGAYGGGFGNGKCEMAGTPITMADGTLRPIEDVADGDSILTVNEGSFTLIPRKVVKRWYVGTKQSWKLRLENGLTLYTTPEHPYLQAKTTRRVTNPYSPTRKVDGSRIDRRRREVGEVAWTPLSELAVGDKLAVPTNYSASTKNPVGTPEEAYLLGMLLGDGCLLNGVTMMAIAEPAVLEKATQLSEPFGVTIKYRSKYDYSFSKHPAATDNRLTNWLRGLGVHGKYANEKFVPGRYYGATQPEIAALLSGLIVTDGWVDNNYLGFCSVSYQLAKDVQALFLRLGILATLSNKTVIYKGEPRRYYNIQVSDRDSICLCAAELDLLHKQSKLESLAQKALHKVPRGRNRRLSKGDLTFFRIAEIEPAEMVDMYDLEVEGTHNFIANHIVAHNTLAGCIKVYNHCQQPDAFFVIGRRHATDLRDSTLRDFLQVFGHLGHYAPGRMSFKFPNGAEVIFRHLDDLRSLTNMNLSGFWIDQAEEVPEESFDYLIGRLRRKTSVREGFITFNPNGHDWIWRRFQERVGSNLEPLPNTDDYHLVMASTLENRQNLPEDYLSSLLAMPEDYRKRFVEGSFDVFAGQIFDEFDPRIHVVKSFLIPNTWERLRAIDHGQNNPTSCLWAAIDFDGNVFIYQEYLQPSTVVSKHVENIKGMSKIRTNKGPVDDIYNYTVIDPSTHAKTRERNGYLFSVADEYLEAGIATVPGQNDIIAGINRLKEYLRINPERYHPFLTDSQGEPLKGSPRLFILENCKELIAHIGQYRWKPTPYGAMEDPKERPLKKDDHDVDALRYLLMSRPQLPTERSVIEPWIWSRPMELARHAKRLGKTVDDLIAEKAGIKSASIRHSSGGIQHSSSLGGQRKIY